MNRKQALQHQQHARAAELAARAKYRAAVDANVIDQAVRLTRYTSHRRVLDRTGIVAKLKELGVEDGSYDGLCVLDV